MSIRICFYKWKALGDFCHCLPVLSGLYKKTGEKIILGIPLEMKRFRGIVQLLQEQEMFESVYFLYDNPKDGDIIIRYDSGWNSEYTIVPIGCQVIKKSIPQFDFDIDSDFELSVPRYDIDYHEDKFIAGDRWSPLDDPKLDTRKDWNVIKENIINDKRMIYLNYNNSLLHNCSLIKYNPNPIITTITAVPILSELMNKPTVVLWSDKFMKRWGDFSGETTDSIMQLHHFSNRKVKMVNFSDFDIEKMDQYFGV